VRDEKINDVKAAPKRIPYVLARRQNNFMEAGISGSQV